MRISIPLAAVVLLAAAVTVTAAFVPSLGGIHLVPVPWTWRF